MINDVSRHHESTDQEQAPRAPPRSGQFGPQRLDAGGHRPADASTSTAKSRRWWRNTKGTRVRIIKSRGPRGRSERGAPVERGWTQPGLRPEPKNSVVHETHEKPSAACGRNQNLATDETRIKHGFSMNRPIRVPSVFHPWPLSYPDLHSLRRAKKRSVSSTKEKNRE